MSKVNVLIGMPTGDSYSFPFVQTYLGAAMITPEEGTVALQPSCYRNICAARNEIADIAIKNSFTHIFFMDSDMAFPVATLSRLLQHGVDIVGGYYNRKSTGVLPNVFKIIDGQWQTYVPEKTLCEVDGIGTGCLLIKTEVFKKMSPPWFTYEPSEKDAHFLKTEDVVFCEHAKQNGFKIFCDGTIRCDHVAMVKLTPADNNQVKVEMLI